MKTLRVAVNNGNTFILTGTRYMNGDSDYCLYQTDEAWNPEKEKFSAFCARNTNSGCSEQDNCRVLEKEFGKLAGDGEFDRWTLVDYVDVYGNEEDGFEVNDVSRNEGLFVPKDASDGQLIEILKTEGWLKPETTKEDVLVDDAGDGMIEFTQAKDMLPLFRFEISKPAGEPEENPEREKIAEQMVSVNVPFVWQVSGTGKVDVPVRAGDSVEEILERALEKAEAESDHIPLPADGTYVDGSFEAVADDPEELGFYNEDLGKRLKKIFG